MGMLDDLVGAILAVSTTNAPWSDAFGLAYKLNLETVPSTMPGVDVVGNTIEYDQVATPDQRQRLVAYGIAMWAMREWSLSGPRVSARYVAERIVYLPAETSATLLAGLATA